MAPHPSVTEVHGVSDYFEVDVRLFGGFRELCLFKGINSIDLIKFRDVSSLHGIGSFIGWLAPLTLLHWQYFV